MFPHLPYSLVLNECALTPCILNPSGFLTEHAIKHNHKPTATPPSTVIAAADNHSLPPFTSLALVPSPPPSEKQWGRYLSFLEERVLSSEQEHDANAYVDLQFALGWHVIRTGAQTEEGGWRCRMLGYRMAGAFFHRSEVVDVAKKSEKKKGKKEKRKGDKGNEEEGKSPSDGISAATGMMIGSVRLGSQCD